MNRKILHRPLGNDAGILSAARAEFVQHPYEKTSINRIPENAGVPKGSFYQYFDDKSDLFGLCILSVYQKIIEQRQKKGA